jgi:hypothetical protein
MDPSNFIEELFETIESLGRTMVEVGKKAIAEVSSAEMVRELVRRGDLTVVEERKEDGTRFRRVIECQKKRKGERVFSQYDLRSRTGAKRYKLRVKKDS